MASVGRNSKYYTHVQPHFSYIKEMLEKGITEKEIAKNLHIAYSSWNKYKVQEAEFAELIKSKDMKPLVKDLENALVKKALGFEYKEKKQYIKKDENGEKVIYTEETTKYQPPSETAIFGALNRFDPNYVKDRAYFELKQQELEMKKLEAESGEW